MQTSLFSLTQLLIFYSFKRTSYRLFKLFKKANLYFILCRNKKISIIEIILLKLKIMEKANRNDDVLHWVTLSAILDYLIEEYGFEELGELIRINCFISNPSKQSALKFLRKTEWARLQVQGLYVRTVKEKRW